MNRASEMSRAPRGLLGCNVLAVCALSFLFVVLGPSGIAVAVADCGAAKSLVDSGYPQRAVAFVEGVNAGLADANPQQCLDERAAAFAAIQKAEKSALAAMTALDDELLEEAKKQADAALQVDRENARAAEVLAALASPPGWWQQLAKGWDGFTAAVVQPAGAVGLPAIGLFFALVVIARVGASLWPTPKTRTTAASAVHRLVWGVALSGIASVMLVMLASGGLGVDTQPARGATAGCLVVVAALGAWLAAWGLATRLRVEVVARRAAGDDLQSAGQVLALLEQFGAAPPQGIERPQGPDVQGLENALAEVEGGLAKALKSAVAAITGWTPWRVVVDHIGEDKIAVAVSRNGRSMGATVIGPDLLAVNDADLKVDPLVFVAAFVLCTLSRAHEGFEGLCGATDWEGLAWQFVASTSKKAAVDDDTAKSLLVKALGRDPSNLLAQVDLANRRWRFSTAEAELKFYDSWLTRILDKLPHRPAAAWITDDPGSAPLRLRVLLTQAAVRINHFFTLEAVKRTPDEEERVAQAIADLCEAIADAEETFNTRRTRVEKGWLDGFKSRAAGMAQMVSEDEFVKLLGGRGPATREVVDSWAKLPRGPRGHYSWACSLASPKLPGQSTSERDWSSVAAQLREAVAEQEVRDWLREDPQMADFREQVVHYKEFLPSPRADLFALDPLAIHRANLSRLKLDATAVAALDPQILSQWLPDKNDDAAKLVNAQKLVSAARTHELLKAQAKLAPIAVEVVAALLPRNQADPVCLAALSDREKAELCTHLATKLGPFLPLRPTADLTNDFADWLNARAAS